MPLEPTSCVENWRSVPSNETVEYHVEPVNFPLDLLAHFWCQLYLLRKPNGGSVCRQRIVKIAFAFGAVGSGTGPFAKYRSQIEFRDDEPELRLIVLSF